MTKFEQFSLQTVRLFFAYLIALFSFFVSRLVFIHRFGKEGIVSDYFSDIVLALVTGARFDMMVMSYGFILVFVLNYFLLLIRSEAVFRWWNNFSKIYLTFAISVFVLIQIIDQQFYLFFKDHFNILIFGFFEDDTEAIISIIWKNYPVLTILFLYAVLTFVIYWLVARVYKLKINFLATKKVGMQVFIALLCVLLFVTGMRGRLTTFPLQIDDLSVSKSNFVNSIVTNGLYALKGAFKTRKYELKYVDPQQILTKNGYNTLQEAYADFLNVPHDSVRNISKQDIYFRTTPVDTFLQNNPPNVIFVLGEGMGGHFFNFHSPTMNTIGSLEKVVKNDIVFRNFQCSSTGTTIFNLEPLLMHTHYSPIGQTKFGLQPYNTSVAIPFNEAGYESSFLYSGKIGWRNLDRFMGNLHYHEIEGKAGIMSAFPEARSNATWGIYDASLYKYIFKKLERNKAKKKPLFVFSLTITNHAPYELPEDYTPYPVEIPDSIQKNLVTSMEESKLGFEAYQYACNALGDFLEELKQSEFGENTIVAFTGDHNVRSILKYGDDDVFWKNAVPFGLYIPEKYKRHMVANTQRYGSHKDIFPTLFNLALSDKTYFGFGDNLLKKNSASDQFFSYNDGHITAGTDMDKNQVDRKAKAYRVLLECYFNELFREQ